MGKEGTAWTIFTLGHWLIFGFMVVFTVISLVVAIGGLKRIQPAETVQVSLLEKQIKELSVPSIIPFEPEQEFTVVKKDFIVFPSLMPQTILVQRKSDKAIVRVAIKNFVDPVDLPSASLTVPQLWQNVKLYKVSWKPNAGTEKDDGYLLALTPTDVAHYFPAPASMGRNPK